MEATEQTTEVVEKTRLEQANHKLKHYVLGSMVVGVIPMPIVDLAVLTGVQLKMLHSLSEMYEIEFSKNMGKSLIAALLGGLVPVSTATTTASLTKFIPVIGQTTGIVTMVLLGGASTYAIGKVFIQHFESGGTFLDFDPESVRAYFAEEFKKGQEIVSKLKPNSKTETAAEAKAAE